jgi:hypothetical protein
MPNFRLSTAVKEAIRTEAKRLADLQKEHIYCAFPLTHAETQDTLLDPDALKLCMELTERHGFKQVSTDHAPTVLLAHPTIRRAICLTLTGPDAFYLTNSTSPTYAKTAVSGGENRYIASMALDRLPPEQVAALASWAHDATRAHRLANLITATVAAVLEECLTVGHVHATWPLLATLAKGDKLWRERFSNPPRNSSLYAPTTTLMATWLTPMRHVETILAGAMLLPPSHREGLRRERVIALDIHAVQKLDGDSQW